MRLDWGLSVSGEQSEKRPLKELSDRLMAEAAEVKRLERVQRSHPVSSPEYQELSDEIASHAREVFRLGEDEETAGDRNPGDGEHGNDGARDRVP